MINVCSDSIWWLLENIMETWENQHNGNDWVYKIYYPNTELNQDKVK